MLHSHTCIIIFLYVLFYYNFLGLLHLTWTKCSLQKKKVKKKLYVKCKRKTLLRGSPDFCHVTLWIPSCWCQNTDFDLPYRNLIIKNIYILEFHFFTDKLRCLIIVMRLLNVTLKHFNTYILIKKSNRNTKNVFSSYI